MGQELTSLDHDARERDHLTDAQLEICRRIVEGESVRTICRDERMPCKSTVMNWLAQEPAFRSAYSMAKQLYAETLAEDILDISDDATGDWVEGENGKELDREHVQRSKLRVDSRKWLAAKLAPKRYGEASMIRVGELDGERREMTSEQRAARLAAIFAGMEKRKGK